MDNFNNIYAIIFINGVQRKVTLGSVLKINNLKIKNNCIFILNNILLIYFNNNYYFRDNFFLKKSFILCRVINNKIVKKNFILKFKKRKHYLKKKNMNCILNEIIVEKFILNFI